MVGRQNICYHVAAFVITLHLICNVTIFFNVVLLTPILVSSVVDRG